VLSLLLGMASLIVFHSFVRSFLNARAALWATAWLSLVPWHIYFSQEIRFYALTTLLTLFSMFTFVRFAERPAPGILVLSASANWLLAWTHPLTVFLVVAQGLFLAYFRWRTWRIALGWGVAHLALALSLLLFVAEFNTERDFALASYIEKPTLIGRGWSVSGYLEMALGIASTTALIGRAPDPVNPAGAAVLPYYGVFAWSLAAVGLTGLLYSLVKIAREDRDRAASRGTPGLRGVEKSVLLALWFCAPPLFLFVGSYLWRPMFMARYLMYAMPPLYIAVGYWLAASRSKFVAPMVFALPLAGYLLFYFPGPSRPPYDAAVATMRKGMTSNAPIFVNGPDEMAIKYYWGEPVPVLRGQRRFVDLVEGRLAPTGQTWLLLRPKEAYEQAMAMIEREGGEFQTWHFPSNRALWLIKWVPPASTPDGPEVSTSTETH
jgi:hypothetical protein